MTEYFNRVNEPNGDSWLIVTTMVEDPQYLNARFVTSSHFKKVPDDSPWKPTPCEYTAVSILREYFVNAVEALARLREGNRRFVAGQIASAALSSNARRVALVAGQEPIRHHSGLL